MKKESKNPGSSEVGAAFGDFYNKQEGCYYEILFY